MFKKLTLIALLLAPLTMWGQKLSKPKIDKLTGDTTWTTSREKLYVTGSILTGQAEGAEFYFLKIPKYKNLSVILIPQTTNSGRALMITKDSKAHFKLADNSTVTLTASITDIGSSSAGFAGDLLITKGMAASAYDISVADLEKLKSSPLTFIRIETTAGNFDGDIKSKNAESFKKALVMIETAK